MVDPKEKTLQSKSLSKYIPEILLSFVLGTATQKRKTFKHCQLSAKLSVKQTSPEIGGRRTVRAGEYNRMNFLIGNSSKCHGALDKQVKIISSILSTYIDIGIRKSVTPHLQNIQNTATNLSRNM